MLQTLATCFASAHLYFDVVHPYFVGKKISSLFRWGLNRPQKILGCAKTIELLEHWSSGDLHKNRQSMLLRALNLLPATRNRSQILHIRFATQEGKHATV